MVRMHHTARAKSAYFMVSLPSIIVLNTIMPAPKNVFTSTGTGFLDGFFATASAERLSSAASGKLSADRSGHVVMALCGSQA